MEVEVYLIVVLKLDLHFLNNLKSLCYFVDNYEYKKTQWICNWYHCTDHKYHWLYHWTQILIKGELFINPSYNRWCSEVCRNPQVNQYFFTRFFQTPIALDQTALVTYICKEWYYSLFIYTPLGWLYSSVLLYLLRADTCYCLPLLLYFFSLRILTHIAAGDTCARCR